MRIVITGGGTGGHVLPALAVAKELEKIFSKKIEILYLGTYQDKKFIPASVKFKKIFAGKFRRYWLSDFSAFIANIIDLFKIFIGIIQSLYYLAKFKPQVIFGKGGFVTIPVAIAGWFFKIPVLLHESDSSLGMANKILLPFSKKIAVSFPLQCYPKLPINKVIFTGSPIRFSSKELKINKKKAKEAFGFSFNLPLILITGGSQGSHPINLLIKRILNQLLEESQLLHICGEKDYDDLLKLKQNLPAQFKPRYKIHKFLKEMNWAYAAADLVISRAGANTLFELAAFGKPAIIIPLPPSVTSHQIKNAKIFRKEGAIILLRQELLTSQTLLKEIKKLLKDKNLCKTLSKNIKKFYEPHAAKRIAKELVNLAKK